MSLSGFQSLRALRVGVCRVVCVLISLLFAAPFAAAQGLQAGGAADMGSVAIGGSSLNYTFIFTATVPTTIQNVTYLSEGKQNTDFIQTAGTQNCTGTLQTGHSCTINVTFTPQQIGFRRGAVVLTDAGGSTDFTQFVYGVGLGPQLSFAPASATTISSLSGVTPSAFKPSSAVYDAVGNLYFFDYQSGRLFLLNTANTLTLLGTFSGNEHSSLAINGMGRSVYLTLPTGVMVVTSGGVATALPMPGVTITSPAGIAIDGGGTIYVSDSQNNRIVQIAADGSAASYLATPGVTLSSPYGLAIDHNYLYIADSGNGRVVQVSVATGAATAMTSLNALNQPYGIAVDASGTVIAADAGGANLVQVSPTGTVTPVVANAGVSIASAPHGVLVETNGDIVVADATLGLVTITRSSNGQLIFPTPTKQGTVDGTDGYETATVENTGNLIIDFASSAPSIGSADFYLGTTNTCPVNQPTSTPLAVAGSCTYSFGFKPSIIGTEQAAVSVLGTAEVTGALVSNTDTLIGTGISPVDTFSVVASPNSTTPGAPVGFTVTAVQGSSTLTSFTGTVTFTMTDPTGAFLGGTSYTFTTADAGTHTFPASLGAKFNTPGTYTITVNYGTITATSNVVTVLYASNTTLTSSANPTAVGGQTTLKATVTGVGNATVPTGTITFYDGTTVVGTCTPVAGVCSITVALPAGSGQILKAVYGGNTTFAPSTSNSITQVVPGYTATFVLTSSVNPSAVGATVTFTATVTPTSGQAGAPVPSGSVTIYSNGIPLCTATTVAGAGSCSFAFPATTTYAITATYTGDTYYAAANSNRVAQIVGTTPVIALTSSANPSATNQAVTFTATMSPPAGLTAVPTGTVTFTSNGTTICANAAITAGKAVCGTTYANPGTYPIIATYNGSGTYVAVTSATLNQVVSNATAKIVLTSSVNPASQNQAVTYTATMSPATGSTTVPTGTVSFFTTSGSTLCAAVPLSVSGVATCTQTYTAPGSYPVLATYNGDGTYGTVTSATLTEQVLFASTTTMTASPNPVAMGSIAALTATVVATPGQAGAGQPTGTVTFFNGTTSIGTCTLTGTTCTLNTTFTVAGTASLTAVYNGSTTFKTSTSATYVESITTYTAIAALTSSVNPSSVNQQTTLTVTVGPNAGATNPPALTGTVNFLDGTTLIGTCTLINGTCATAVSFATTGNHFLTAVYSGDSNYGGVTVGPYRQVVNTLLTAQVTLNPTPNPVALNAPITLTGTVIAAPGQTGAGTPTGSVRFYDGTTALGVCVLSAGSCSINPSFSTPGAHPLTAIYTGSTTFNTVSTANATTEIVNAYVATVAMTSSVNPVPVNQQTLLTATVGAEAGQSGAPTPTGSVKFFDGTTQIGTCPLAGTSCSVPVSFTTAGTHALTAAYSGDANFGTLTSPSYPEIVTNAIATIAVSASPNPVFLNTPITLTAAVASANVTGLTPSGTVTFLSGTQSIGSAAIVNGVATLSTSFPLVNTYSITAVYNGDTNFMTVTSTPVSEVVEDFTFTLATPTGGSVTVLGGHTATYTFTVTPVGGTVFPAAINFTLAGFPSNSTYSFSPATVAAGSGVSTVTLTVTPPAVAMLQKPVLPSSRGRDVPIVFALMLFPFALRMRGKRGRRPAALLLWLMMMAGAMGLTGCLTDASSGYYGETQQTYSLTATATSGVLSHNAGATLVRQ